MTVFAGAVRQGGRGTRPSRRFPARAGAFTLIEVVVVIVIIAVCASVMVPSYSRMMASARFQSAVHDAAGVFAWARDAAIQYAGDAVVQYDPQSNTLTAYVPAIAAATDDAPSALQEQQEQQTQPDAHTISLNENATIVDYESDTTVANGTSTAVGGTGQTGPQGGITFHEDGSSDGGRFTVLSADGHRALVEVASATGRVSVSQDGGQ